jgi:hypothetical protein
MKKNDYYNFIISFGLNLKWHQKLFIKLMLILPKGKRESIRFNQVIRGYRASIKPIDDAMNEF